MIHLPDTKNLCRKGFWLCQLRWFAFIGTLLAITLTMLFLNLQLNYTILYLIAGLLLLSNIYYIVFLRKYFLKRDEKSIIKIKNNINIQILFDFIFLTLLLHFSGGIENPFIIFYIFHMIISSILLSKKWTTIHTTIGIFLFTSLALTEFLGIIPHYTINKYITSLVQNDPFYLFSSLLIFIAASYLVVYITSSLVGKLRAAEQGLKAANMDLIKKDRIKEEYTQRLTHDIKGHVSAITSNLEVVYKQFVGPIDPKNQEFIEKAYHRTQIMIDLIHDLLALTNMRLNNKFEKGQIDIIQTLNDTVNAFKIFSSSKNITLTMDFNIINPYYSGVKTSIEEVLRNLVQNAIKYTPEGGKVHLQSFSDSNNFSFTVTDTGYGIPEADLPYVFNEFFRASNIKNSIKEGTGLGLSLVKATVERHHGTVHVESAVGKGSVFTVNLPHGIQ